MLEIDGLHCRYGKVSAVRDLTLEVKQGELVTLIGANGAGKTTTLKAISGLLAPAAGRIVFDGEDITGAAPRTILARGIAHCPEGRHIFPDMTVQENLDMGCYLRKEPGGCSSASPYWRSAAGRWPAPCPAASSRCSPSAAR